MSEERRKFVERVAETGSLHEKVGERAGEGVEWLIEINRKNVEMCERRGKRVQGVVEVE